MRTVTVRRWLAAATGSAVALALLSAPATARTYDKPGRASTFDLGAPLARSTDGPGVLVAQSFVLAARPTGYPIPGATPGQTLASATATVKVSGTGTETTYFPTASVTLAGAPGRNDYRIHFGMGLLNGTRCEVSWSGSTQLSYDGTTNSVNGGYNPDYFPTPARPFECAAVELTDGDTSLDALIGAEGTNSYESPVLGVGDLELLGAPQKKLGLVRGVPTKVSVDVTNTGGVIARDVVVRGSGKGLTVSSETIESIAADDGTTSVVLTVKLTGRKPGRLTLSAAGSGVSAKRRVTVKPVKAPAPPRAGSYRNKSGSVRFSIRGGRIVGWSGTMQTTCGGYGTPPTYTQNTYDFPRTKIPRNGIVQATKKGSNYTTHLQLKVAGAKVTKGRFSYFGPAGCRAFTTFTAKRGR